MKTYNVNDKVVVTKEGLIADSKSIPAHIGYTKEHMNWRNDLSSLCDRGVIGVVTRVWDSGRLNVEFEGTCFGVRGNMVAKVEPDEKPTEKKPMPERMRDYVTFEELSLCYQNKVIRNTFKNPGEIKAQLYHSDGTPACMTIQERKDWYTSDEKTKTETVYRYRLSSEWSSAVIWGRDFKQALSRRGKLYERNEVSNSGEIQEKTLIINKIIEVKQTKNYSYVLGEKTEPFPGFMAIVKLEDGRRVEVSAVVEDSLILR